MKLLIVDEKEMEYRGEVVVGDGVVKSPPDGGVSGWVRYNVAMKFLRERNIMKLDGKEDNPPCPICSYPHLASYYSSQSNSFYLLCINCGRLYTLPAPDGYQPTTTTTPDSITTTPYWSIASVEVQKEVLDLIDKIGVKYYKEVDLEEKRRWMQKWLGDWVDVEVVGDRISPPAVLKIAENMLFSLQIKGILPYGAFSTPLWDNKDVKTLLAEIGSTQSPYAYGGGIPLSIVRGAAIQETLLFLLYNDKSGKVRKAISTNPKLVFWLFYPFPDLEKFFETETKKAIQRNISETVNTLWGKGYPVTGFLNESGKVVFVLDAGDAGKLDVEIATFSPPAAVKTLIPPVENTLFLVQTQNHTLPPDLDSDVKKLLKPNCYLLPQNLLSKLFVRLVETKLRVAGELEGYSE